MRLAMGGDGEIYVLSKSDGLVRKLVGGVSPPGFAVITLTNGIATLSWYAISNRQYRVQFRSDLEAGGWSELAGDVTATSEMAEKSDSVGGTARYYRLVLLP
jgi:hypothetical protein